MLSISCARAIFTKSCRYLHLPAIVLSRNFYFTRRRRRRLSLLLILLPGKWNNRCVRHLEMLVHFAKAPSPLDVTLTGPCHGWLSSTDIQVRLAREAPPFNVRHFLATKFFFQHLELARLQLVFSVRSYENSLNLTKLDENCIISRLYFCEQFHRLLIQGEICVAKRKKK